MGEYYLAHHGIKGMQWGVRRYQNYDGTLTQKGVQRYQKAEKKYQKADAAYKEIKAKRKDDRKSVTKLEYQHTKNQRKLAKSELNNSYDRLKMDKKADQGKMLYKQGKTITENKAANENRRIAIATVGSVAQAYLKVAQADNTAKITAASITAGAALVNEAYNLKIESDNKKLRAYYAH